MLTGVAGAIGLANIARDLLAWHQLFVDLIDAWQQFVRPVASALFGWFFALFNIDMPDIWKDYLSVGVLTMVGGARVALYAETEYETTVITDVWGHEDVEFWTRVIPWMIAFLLAWPLAFTIYLVAVFRMFDFSSALKETYYIGSTFIYFLILLMINYVLVNRVFG